MWKSILNRATGSDGLRQRHTSIAAALLNAGDVLGIDIDPTAVEVAKDNIRLNGVGSTAKVQYGDLAKGLDYRANIIVANLMADLVMMSEDAAAHLRRGGKFISSES